MFEVKEFFFRVQEVGDRLEGLGWLQGRVDTEAMEERKAAKELLADNGVQAIDIVFAGRRIGEWVIEALVEPSGTEVKHDRSEAEEARPSPTAKA